MRKRRKRSLEVTRSRQVLLFLTALCTLVVLCYITPERREERTSFVCEVEGKSASKQKQALIVSYPRSGSSFLGDLLQSPRNSFYYFEPLHFFGTSVPEGRMPEVPGFLQALLGCRIPGDFLRWVWEHGDYHTLRRSWNLWAACEPSASCYDLCFLRAFCGNQTFSVAKSIRLPVQVGLTIGAPVIHLVRDPRGTMHSRADQTIAEWCSNDPACFSATRHCEVVLRDLNHACERPPDAAPYILIRYEDLALAPNKVAEDLFSFLGEEKVPEETRKFLKVHTNTDQGTTKPTFLDRPYTTVRNSTRTAFAWGELMPYHRVREVQDACAEVIRRLNYPFISRLRDRSPNFLVNYIRTHPLQDYCK